MSDKGTHISSAHRLEAAKRRPGWVPTAEAAEHEIRRMHVARYRNHRLRMLLFITIFALAFGYLAFSLCFELIEVKSAGMSPTLESGSLVFCVKQKVLDRLAGIVPESTRRIGRNDLVLIPYTPEAREEGAAKPESTLLIKRAIAMAGDEIDSAGGELIINRDEIVGKLVSSDLVYPVTVPTGCIFALGDNRELSVDSRQRTFGMVAEADVIARPVAVVWPAYAMGWVK